MPPVEEAFAERRVGNGKKVPQSPEKSPRSGAMKSKGDLQNAASVLDMIFRDLQSNFGQKSLWHELPMVKEDGILG